MNLLEALDVVKQSGNDGLAEVRNQITKTRNELDRLIALESYLAPKTTPEQAAPPVFPTPKPPSIGTLKLTGRGMIVNRRKAALFCQGKGTVPHRNICAYLGATPAELDKITNHPWFQNSNDGVSLTPQGRRECED